VEKSPTDEIPQTRRAQLNDSRNRDCGRHEDRSFSNTWHQRRGATKSDEDSNTPAMADPDTPLGGTLCGGSRHSARSVGANSICFPVSDIYFFVGRGPKSIARLDGGAMIGFVLWVRHWIQAVLRRS